MGNYAGTAAMLTVFDMQLDEGVESAASGVVARPMTCE